jgi:pSer/pThr/pTyr-binding forkhead associated (FHA) protein
VISPWFSPPSQGQPVAWLLCTNGKQQGYRYPIEQALVRIGAGAGNDIVLNDDEYISRAHASIRYDVSNLFLQDLHSGNGTFLNDERLVESAMPLAPGDRIRLGRTTLELQAS